MYDGAAHARLARIVLCGLAVLGAVLCFVDWRLAAGLVAGGVIGWFLTPDVDLMAWTHEDYRAVRWLKVLGLAWVMYWTTYALVFRHRSRWSHSWLGTVIRALWLFGPTLMVLRYALHITFPVSIGWLSLLMGWLVQDSAHYVMDGLGVTGWSRS